MEINKKNYLALLLQRPERQIYPILIKKVFAIELNKTNRDFKTSFNKTTITNQTANHKPDDLKLQF